MARLGFCHLLSESDPIGSRDGLSRRLAVVRYALMPAAKKQATANYTAARQAAQTQYEEAFKKLGLTVKRYATVEAPADAPRIFTLLGAILARSDVRNAEFISDALLPLAKPTIIQLLRMSLFHKYVNHGLSNLTMHCYTTSSLIYRDLSSLTAVPCGMIRNLR
jgi:hypothetical protein